MMSFSLQKLSWLKKYASTPFVFLGAFSIVPISLYALYIPPTIASQGVAHRIFYLHVPIAWVALYAPLFSALCAILYLNTKKDIYDVYSLANAKIAYLFSIAVLISGPLWASTEWGSYWNWKDSRLISFFVLFLALSSYFLIRWITENAQKEKVFASLLSFLSAISAFLTWFAIRWIEPDTHPPPVLDKMSPKIKIAFWLSVLAYHFLFWIFLQISIRHERIRRLSFK